MNRPILRNTFSVLLAVAYVCMAGNLLHAQPPASSQDADSQDTTAAALAPVPVDPEPDPCVVVTPHPSCKKECCREKDAVICFDVYQSVDHAYTGQGVHTFVNIFEAAVARGIENVAIRGFNATRTCPKCERGNCEEHEEEDETP